MSENGRKVHAAAGRKRLPRWLRKDIPAGARSGRVRGLLNRLKLSTVCHSARCPNRAECFARGTATFMILGRRCTRDCRFCAVTSGEPEPVRDDEPAAVTEACAELGLSHVVITSVTRDDLADGGAGHFARTVAAVRERLPKASTEVLTPDFGGDAQALDTVLCAGCNVFNHNVETVPRLYGAVRPGADYDRSVSMLARAAEWGRRTGGRLRVKSGLMVGLGETNEEIVAVMGDLRQAGCEILTIGQYLQPSNKQLPVERFVRPGEFGELKEQGLRMGFAHISAGPFVRSSYRAEQALPNCRG